MEKQGSLYQPPLFLNGDFAASKFETYICAAQDRGLTKKSFADQLAFGAKSVEKSSGLNIFCFDDP